MRRGLRTIAVAILAVAVLATTPGICLCHRQADSAAAGPGEHSCCHHARLLIHAAGITCCQVERAQHNATAPEISMVAAPVFDAVRVDAQAWASLAPRLLRVNVDASPPGRPLRL